MTSIVWDFVHNVIAHPLMFFVRAPWAERFHDWTARMAWGDGATEAERLAAERAAKASGYDA